MLDISINTHTKRTKLTALKVSRIGYSPMHPDGRQSLLRRLVKDCVSLSTLHLKKQQVLMPFGIILRLGYVWSNQLVRILPLTHRSEQRQ